MNELVSLVEAYVKVVNSRNPDFRVLETLVYNIAMFYPNGIEELERVCKENHAIIINTINGDKEL